MSLSLALVIATVASPAWWTEGDSACPDNGRLAGAAPPRGLDIGCKRPSGAWHGSRTVWHAGGSARKYEGHYRRGIEHGHWVWWRADGSKGLEGDYYAGKKSGVWRSWDASGKERRSEFETFSDDEVAVDGAIQRALEAAKAMGNKELARELDHASRDLRKSGRRTAAAPNASRGQGDDRESIGARAEMEGEPPDLPDQDMGVTSFAEGGTTEVTPYVRRAIRTATKRVEQCYRKARARRPRLSGRIVARFSIAPNGRATNVRIVESAMTETMNQCVKKALRKMEFGTHDGAGTVDVISPWTFKAPGS